jgi:sulfoxide reductase catalytic subunit YedY
MSRNTPKPSEITPESVYERRRDLLRAGMALLPAALTACNGRAAEPAAESTIATPTAEPTQPARPRSPYSTDETQTLYRDAATYNNYYEFGTDKSDPWRLARSFKPLPWSVEIAGHAEDTGTFSFEDLLKPFALEERIYRLRCVEGWSMVIPWLGVPLGDVLKRFRPTAQAKYVAFTTLMDPARMPGQDYPVLDWPYREGLRIDEAMHPLTLLATGMYGKRLPNQNGAPLRLVVPWKYGYKSIKGIVRIEFTETQPATSWNLAAADEYGFYSNVNPEHDHPRWSQRTERRIAGEAKLFGGRIETQMFNGYAEEVASLYAGMDLHRYF